jgi:GTP-binding protein
MTKTIVLVGRPNVGKSTLFNRLSQTRRALMSSIPGTTRDWLEGLVHWGSQDFRVIDTGGYTFDDKNSPDLILSSVRAQVEHWVREADVVLWLVDGKDGLTSLDESLGPRLRRLSRRVVLVVNKVDNDARQESLSDFYRLGFSNVVAISATHGRNINGLLDALGLDGEVSSVSTTNDPSLVPTALVGRPNVGKSSLLNRLIGEERMIVSDIPGTTRDTIDTRFTWEGKNFIFMDTAGLRSKKSLAVGLEGLTRIMAERALERCDVALLLLDGVEGVLEGDTAVGCLIQEKRRACVVAINKWDAVLDRHQAAQMYRDQHSSVLPFLAWCPLLFISAKTGHQVPELFQAIKKAHQQFHRRFEAEDLKNFFWSQVQERPYTHRGRKLVFYSAEQVATAPPTFIFRTNLDEEDIHFSYQRHLEKVFRAHRGLEGSPLVFRFKRGKK